MTKAEFVARVARKAGLTRAEAARALDAMDAVLSLGPGLLVAHAAKAAIERARPNTPVQQVRELAGRVWENGEDAEEFLSTPHPLLDDQTPLAAAQTPEGAERVRKILLALEYGLPV
ncbi:MAG TPA: antitoxin Xre/MbcA/ParS toxin-binding domain-containing protein [Longimicrobium sp.]|nr:antitoxin Xre/MbcA/ParS toxin-binding domain-containing protein [Longimicrobium sp.]